VLLGDGELQEGSVWEAAIAAASLRLDRLVRRGRPQRAPAHRPHRAHRADGTAGRALARLRLGRSARSNGHDPGQVAGHLAAAPWEPGKPSVLIARTVKGHGLPFLEGRAASHYVTLSERNHARALRALGDALVSRATREAYRDRLLPLMNQNPDLMCLDTDTGLFNAEYVTAAGDQYLNLGIAEHNLMGMAAGMAACGRMPFVNTMAAFATSRALEPIKIDIAYNRLPVRIMATHGGLGRRSPRPDPPGAGRTSP